MKATGIGIEVLENGKVIGRLTAAEFQKYMDRPRAFLADLVKDFNLQNRGTTVQTYIIKK